MGLEWFFRDRSVMIHYNFLTNFCGNSKERLDSEKHQKQIVKNKKNAPLFQESVILCHLEDRIIIAAACRCKPGYRRQHTGYDR